MEESFEILIRIKDKNYSLEDCKSQSNGESCKSCDLLILCKKNEELFSTCASISGINKHFKEVK